ncbi:MAG: ABC transporter permease [Puniceicoccaceae bacterium]
MNLLAGILQGFVEIWAHKFRTLLSMTGIILGVAALVAMIGLVQGMMVQFRESFEASGGLKRLEVADSEPPEEQRPKAFLSEGRTITDYLVLRETLPLADYVAASIRLSWMPARSSQGFQFGPFEAVTPETALAEDIRVKDGGRFIASLDVLYRKSVVVISPALKMGLFPKGEAVGETLAIRGRTFTVIGVTKLDPGASMWHWRNRLSYIPITTAVERFDRANEKVSDLVVNARDVSDLPSLEAHVANVLRVTHNGIEDFEVRNREEELAELRTMQRSFLYSLGGVAAITLLVGGLGITNVMLASLNERIREVGVRKAVGARPIDIFAQFLSEAVMIGLIGGFIGLLASVGLIDLLNGIVPEELGGRVLLVEWALVAGFAFSMIVGVAAGIYPAFKAARLDVVEALSRE